METLGFFVSKRHFKSAKTIALQLKEKKIKKDEKSVDNKIVVCYNLYCRRARNTRKAQYGSIAQLGEHLPYKQRVIGSSPIVSTIDSPRGESSGLVVQLVRTLACHARGRGFDPHPGRHFFISFVPASVAQLVEQGTENPRVVGSIPTGGTIFNLLSLHSKLKIQFLSHADLAHLVERDLAKVEVAGSSPVIRSIFLPIYTAP